MGKKRGGLGKKGGGLGKKCILVGKKLNSLGKKNCIISVQIIQVQPVKKDNAPGTYELLVQ